MPDANTAELAQRAQAYIRRVEAGMVALSTGELARLIEELLSAKAEQRTVFIFGNGGSSSTASHMASDLSKGVGGFPRVRAISLTDNVPVLTAWANDVAYDQVFTEQLRTLARPRDLAIAITGSGNSPNVVNGVVAAKELGMFVVGLLGFGGGKVASLVDLPIVVASNEYGPVEDIHLIINHLVTTVMRESLAGGSLPQYRG